MKPATSRISSWLCDTPLPWAMLGFGVYFYYAQFIANVGWNAIELIIAQHLLEHGAYVTSLDYPSALAWRPVLPTLLVAFLRLWTSDPLLIYRIICGSALATLAATLFLSARALWGRMAAHAAAFFTLACPAITLDLINHTHSYSHLGGLLFLGPALLCSLRLLKDAAAGTSTRGKLYPLTGILWGLCYLSRNELALFCGLHFFLVTWLLWRRRASLRPLAAYALGFLVFFLSYNVYANHVADRDGLLGRKAIYGMYASQGWADPAPGAGLDTEAEGYAYAKKLYGDPVANGESVLTAIRHNPAAFAHRIRLNAQAFYARYCDPDFFSPWWSGVVVIVGGLLLAGRLPTEDRWPVGFLFGLFFLSHFVLIFHIDPRYLSINIPPLILLTSYAVHRLGAGLRRLPGLAAAVVTAGLVAGLIFVSRNQFYRLVHHRARDDQTLAAMKSLGRHFHAVVRQPRLAQNIEPHIAVFFPASPVIQPENQFLVAYFSHTAWVNRGADADFPRGRLYSFRECPDDYIYLPAERVQGDAARKDPRIIDEYDNPVLGHYYLFQLNR